MELSDKEWELIEPLLSELPLGKRGRPWRDNREVLEGVLWVMRTGAPWRDMPKAYPPLNDISNISILRPENINPLEIDHIIDYNTVIT